MKELLTRLEKILILQAQIHQKLLDEAELKRLAIIGGSIEDMESILAREKELLSNSEKAEAARQTVAGELKALLNIDEEPLRVQSIIDRVGREAPGLDKARQALKQIIEKLRYRTRQNEELLKASIEHVNGFLKAVNDATASNQTYGRQGQNGKGSLRILDRTA